MNENSRFVPLGAFVDAVVAELVASGAIGTAQITVDAVAVPAAEPGEPPLMFVPTNRGDATCRLQFVIDLPPPDDEGEGDEAEMGAADGATAAGVVH
jgi:hypothetical protein